MITCLALWTPNPWHSSPIPTRILPHPSPKKSPFIVAGEGWEGARRKRSSGEGLREDTMSPTPTGGVGELGPPNAPTLFSPSVPKRTPRRETPCGGGAGLFLVHSEFGGWGGGSHALGWAGSALQGRLFTPNLNPRSTSGAREGNSGESKEKNTGSRVASSVCSGWWGTEPGFTSPGHVRPCRIPKLF